MLVAARKLNTFTKLHSLNNLPLGFLLKFNEQAMVDHFEELHKVELYNLTCVVVLRCTWMTPGVAAEGFSVDLCLLKAYVGQQASSTAAKAYLYFARISYPINAAHWLPHLLDILSL